MAKKNYNYKEEYVYGAAAPKREYAAPKREPKHQENEQIIHKNRENNDARERRLPSRFGALYTFFVVTAVAVTLFVCTSYINQINTQSEQAKEIVMLQEQQRIFILRKIQQLQLMVELVIMVQLILLGLDFLRLLV